jgi:hypothetical protein
MSSRGPSPAPRAHWIAQWFSAVGLAALMLITLTFSGRDGVPTGANYDPFAPTHGVALTRVSAPTQSGVPSTAGVVDDLSPPRFSPVRPMPLPQPPIPTTPPVQLLIASMNVHRAVEAVGLDRRGVMRLPVNWWNAGWYQGGPVPGAPGDAVIEGHAGYPDEPLIFGRLATLRTGDKIVVVLGDGSRQLFLVVSMAKLAVGTAPQGMAEPYGPPRLTLITCTGSFDKDHYSYSQRLVVEASYAGLV